MGMRYSQIYIENDFAMSVFLAHLSKQALLMRWWMALDCVLAGFSIWGLGCSAFGILGSGLRVRS